MPFDRIADARKGIVNEQAAARQIADAQMQKTGFTRTPAFAPQPRPRNPYVPESERVFTPPLAPSGPLDTSVAGEPKTKRRSFGVGQGDQ